jgi:DNA-binding NtrC family response regulator
LTPLPFRRIRGGEFLRHAEANSVTGREPSPNDPLTNLVGSSPAFLASVELIRRVAGCDATVLIQGETGTGKELAARAIHYLGSRRDAPFVPINCGAIPESLVENELFGHARGAYTDARESREGVIAQAEGGTLFLDEVEAIGPRGQVALLRFLENHEYRPVGGSPCGANVRVIASSNADLTALAAEGRYRQDLLFRLTILVLERPPLRARGDDVTQLAETFVRRFCRQYRKPSMTLHPDATSHFAARGWPGNVRELENLIHRAVVLTDGAVLRIDPTPGSADPGVEVRPGALTVRGFREAKARAIALFEKAYLAELLARTRGNLSLAARLSGKERSRLGKLVKKHGLARAQFSGEAETA